MGTRAIPAAITPKTDKAKVPLMVERDLSTLTGEQLLVKYTKSPLYEEAFRAVTGQPVTEVAPTHNPFWHYLNQVWYDEPEGKALLGEKHRELADKYLDFALGKYDDKDGFHYQWPRRAMKSTLMMAFADWVPKFHYCQDRHAGKKNPLLPTVLYSHNVEDEAEDRLETIKNKNRYHPYMLSTFPDFALPDGEWGTKKKWNWPCRKASGSVAESSMTAKSAAAKKAGKGYNYKLLDDWEDEDCRESPENRRSIANDYDQRRKLKAVPFTREASQGTPYHTQSLYRPMVESKRPDGTPRYEAWVVPAADPDFTRSNFPTIPSLTLEGLAKERNNEMARRGHDDFFWLQMMLKANTARTQPMSWSWFHKVTVNEWRLHWARIPHLKCVFVDSAWKGTKDQQEGCYSAIGMVAIFQIGPTFDRVLLDLTMSNSMMSDAGADEMCRMMHKWATVFWAAEQTSDKTMVGLVNTTAKHFVPRVYPYWVDLKGWSKKAKEARIERVGGAAKTGHFHYLETIDPRMLALLADEADTYPEDTHRDGLDMLGNSFAEEVEQKRVPVGVPMFEGFDPTRLPEPGPAMAGRHVRIPMYGTH